MATEIWQFDSARARDSGWAFELGGQWDFETDAHTIIEEKLDGVRALVHCTPEGVIITSRTHKEFQDNVPHLRDNEFLNRMGRAGYTILDGEITAPTDDDTLANTMTIMGSKPARAIERQSEIGNAVLTVFDILQWGGVPVHGRMWQERRSLLERIPTDDTFRVIRVHWCNERSERKALVEQMVRDGAEGVILKDPEATYFDKAAWLKVKERVTVDAQVVGWNAGAGKYEGTIGSLVVAVLDKATGDLRVIASVAPGDDEQRDKMYRRLNRLKPETIERQFIIVEMEAQTWTPAGMLRHPRILRYRTDKDCPDALAF